MLPWGAVHGPAAALRFASFVAGTLTAGLAVPLRDRRTQHALADCYSNPYIELREMAFLLKEPPRDG